jgi:signal transduction histidine kinase
VANISHELRTPLTHIRGYLDLLFTESFGELNLEQKKALGISLQSSLRLQSLIDDLILFSQASRGQMTLSISPVNLDKILVSVIDRLKPRAEDHHLSLDVDIDPTLPYVQADEEKLIWVITQLLDNAIKFTNPGGKVSLKIIRDPATVNMITISIADTGIGISKHHLKEIFEPFHQLDGSATRRYGGTGLGLTLVLQIIEAHGSLINIQSELEKGTTISFPMLITKVE